MQHLPSEERGEKGEAQERYVKVLSFPDIVGGGWKGANKAASGAVVVQEEGTRPGVG